jgi:hypothetical protein
MSAPPWRDEGSRIRQEEKAVRKATGKAIR